MQTHTRIIQGTRAHELNGVKALTHLGRMIIKLSTGGTPIRSHTASISSEREAQSRLNVSGDRWRLSVVIRRSLIAAPPVHDDIAQSP